MAGQTELLKNQAQPLTQSKQRPTIVPACDIYEGKDEFLLVADFPGVTKENLTLNFEKNELSLEGRREVSGANENFLGAEYQDCDFKRLFIVPNGIDQDKISAELKDGILRLHLPKSEVLKPRQITVKAG
jgi:HSP20 family molecular chaperone IbpA